MISFFQIIRVTFLGAVRDRILLAIIGVGGLMFLLVPAFSMFSMRQAREVAITLSLSACSLTLLLLVVLLGASSLWRDIERRYTAGLLGLPLSRQTYVLGRFAGLAIFVGLCGVLLGGVALVVVSFSRGDMSSGLELRWTGFLLSIGGDILKYILLLSFAFLFSSLSTSLFLPVFGTLGVYLAGAASQEVMDYLSSEASRQLPLLTRTTAQIFYYLIPNFSVFNFKVQAIYGLDIPLKGILYSLAYFVIYILILLYGTVAIFNRRELP
jgi:ABC-type transport system involved in multi-copper enzyme maturation permease subunit